MRRTTLSALVLAAFSLVGATAEAAAATVVAKACPTTYVHPRSGSHDTKQPVDGDLVAGRPHARLLRQPRPRRPGPKGRKCSRIVGAPRLPAFRKCHRSVKRSRSELWDDPTCCRESGSAQRDDRRLQRRWSHGVMIQSSVWTPKQTLRPARFHDRTTLSAPQSSNDFITRYA